MKTKFIFLSLLSFVTSFIIVTMDDPMTDDQTSHNVRSTLNIGCCFLKCFAHIFNPNTNRTSMTIGCKRSSSICTCCKKVDEIHPAQEIQVVPTDIIRYRRTPSSQIQIGHALFAYPSTQAYIVQPDQIIPTTSIIDPNER